MKSIVHTPEFGWHREGDVSFETAMERGQQLADKGMFVYFKCTCQHCQQRITGAEPFKIYRRYDCAFCGKETEVKAYGFMATNIML